MPASYAQVAAHSALLRAALRCIAADYFADDADPHADAESDHAGGLLALAARELVAAVDALPEGDQPIGWGREQQSAVGMPEDLDRMTPQTCPAGTHADWAVDSEQAHACPWCEIARLRAELRGRDREWSYRSTSERGGVFVGITMPEADIRKHVADLQARPGMTGTHDVVCSDRTGWRTEDEAKRAIEGGR